MMDGEVTLRKLKCILLEEINFLRNKIYMKDNVKVGQKVKKRSNSWNDPSKRWFLNLFLI